MVHIFFLFPYSFLYAKSFSLQQQTACSDTTFVINFFHYLFPVSAFFSLAILVEEILNFIKFREYEQIVAKN